MGFEFLPRFLGFKIRCDSFGYELDDEERTGKENLISR